MLSNDLGNCRFGFTPDGKPGWKEKGADTVYPFKNGPAQMIVHIGGQGVSGCVAFSRQFLDTCEFTRLEVHPGKRSVNLHNSVDLQLSTENRIEYNVTSTKTFDISPSSPYTDGVACVQSGDGGTATVVGYARFFK